MIGDLWSYTYVISLRQWESSKGYRSYIRRFIRREGTEKLRKAGAPRERPIFSIQREPDYFSETDDILRVRMLVGWDARITHYRWRKTRRGGR